MRARSWLIAMVILWIVAAFLLINAGMLNMHSDEELSYRATKGDLAFTLNIQMSVQDNQAPLWFVTFWAWQQMVGDAEYTSRVLSVLTILPALALTYRLGRRWFRSTWVGLLAPLLLIGNGFFFNYALDIRPYPMVILSAALVMWAFTLWLDRRTVRSAVFYGVTIALLLYVHYLLVFLVVVQALYFLLVQRLTRRAMGQALLAGLIGVGLWLPWLPTFVNQVVGLHRIELESGTARGVAGIGVSTQATTLPTLVALLNTATNGVIWLYALVLLIGVILLWRSARYWLALGWAIGVPAIALAANMIAAVYAPRFVSHLLIGLALALAAALVRLPRRIGLVGAALLIGVNLLTFPGTIPVRVPYRDLYRQVSALAKPGDVVLNISVNQLYDGALAWQQAHYLAPELQAGITADAAGAQMARRVWFMTGDWFDDGVRAEFDALEPTHPVQQVIGQCDRAWCYLAQLMEAPPLSSALRFGANMDFWGIDVDSVTRQTISTRLWWRVEQAPDLDYSISLRLEDSSGALLAQKDGPVNHYGSQIVPTSQFEPGKIYIDWRAIDLPPGLPTGTYTLKLVVYQSWDNVRLLADGSDSLTLYTFSLD